MILHVHFSFPLIVFSLAAFVHRPVTLSASAHDVFFDAQAALTPADDVRLWRAPASAKDASVVIASNHRVLDGLRNRRLFRFTVHMHPNRQSNRGITTTDNRPALCRGLLRCAIHNADTSFVKPPFCFNSHLPRFVHQTVNQPRHFDGVVGG